MANPILGKALRRLAIFAAAAVVLLLLQSPFCYIFVAATVFGFAAKHLPRRLVRVRTAWYAVIVVALLAAFFVARPHGIPTCHDSWKGFLGRIPNSMHVGLNLQPPDSKREFLGEFEKRCIELERGAVQAPGASELLLSARNWQRVLASDIKGEDTEKLHAAIQNLTDSVSKINSEGFEVRERKLESLIQHAQQQAKDVQNEDMQAQTKFLQDFGFQAEAESFAGIRSDMDNLQGILRRYIDNRYKGNRTLTSKFEAKLNESTGTVDYQETIGVRFNSNVALDEIDLSDIATTGQLENLDPHVQIQLENSRPFAWDVQKDPKVRVPENQRSLVHEIKVTSTVTKSAGLRDACKEFRVLPVKEFKVSWPGASESIIALTMEFHEPSSPSPGNGEPYIVREVIPGTSPLSAIEIPDYSYLSSDYAMKEDKSRPGAVRPDPDMSIDALASNEPVAIEILPTLLRNFIVQNCKQYLFPLNAIAAVILLLIGSAFGAWVGS